MVEAMGLGLALWAKTNCGCFQVAAALATAKTAIENRRSRVAASKNGGSGGSDPVTALAQSHCFLMM